MVILSGYKVQMFLIRIILPASPLIKWITSAMGQEWESDLISWHWKCCYLGDLLHCKYLSPDLLPGFNANNVVWSRRQRRRGGGWEEEMSGRSGEEKNWKGQRAVLEGREQKVWRGSEGGRGRGIKTVICNSFCNVCVCLCINGITSCSVCVFVGRLCVLIHQCARPD